MNAKDTLCVGFILLIFAAAPLCQVVPIAFAATTIEVVPSSFTFGPNNCVGKTFNVSVEIHNVENLYGIDIQFGWDETWIGCVGHQKRIPVETHFDGLLHTPTISVKDDLSEGVPMDGANPNSDYWLVEASAAPAAGFIGNGVVFVMTFVIEKQPIEPELDKTLSLNITAAILADKEGSRIPCTASNGAVLLRAKPPTAAEKPLLKVSPKTVSNIMASKDFNLSIQLMALDYTDLDPVWDVAGFDIVFSFNVSLMQALSLTIDPSGWFASFWPNGTLKIAQDIDNGNGRIHIAFAGVPGVGGLHVAPFGKGILANVSFHPMYISTVYPSPSCVLGISSSLVAGFPHPERSEKPWNNSNSAPLLEHFVENATFKSQYKPIGAYIDVYTQYPYPYGGQGYCEPSDMFWPQKQVCLFADVSFNSVPEQQKDVVFEVRSPNGTIWGIFYGRTDENGVAETCFRLPWPCDNPESLFGIWKAIATVDVACKVVNDTVRFKYDYHVRAWRTILDRPGYQHGQYVKVKTYYGTVSMQTFTCVITVTATDETAVAFACAFTQNSVGGAEWCTYKNASSEFCLYIPKFAKLGLGTIWVGLLHDLPTNGGDAVYPTKEPETVVHFGIIYDYLVHIWSTSLDDTSYNHGDSMLVTINFGAMSMPTFSVLFAVTVVDETGAPIIWRYMPAVVGGAGLMSYTSESITFTLLIPKSARAGVGTIYVSVFLDGLPSDGGSAIYPTEEPETIVHFLIQAS